MVATEESRVNQMEMSVSGTSHPRPNKKCPCRLRFISSLGSFCDRFRLQTDDATGCAMNASGAGPVVMSNAFLATSLLTLAKMELGCDLDLNTGVSMDVDAEERSNHECEGKVHGFKPSSLISIIATISGILSCILLPFLGAIVDFTRFRHALGIVSSSILVLIQAMKIGTVEVTWFAMAILQAINGFMYLVVMLCQYSYLPEIEKDLDSRTMMWYNSLFYILQFGNQIIFLSLVILISSVMHLNNVVTAQVGQAINVPITGVYFCLSWYFFTQKEAKNQLRDEDEETIFTAGFKQVFRTAGGLFRFYPKTVGLYFVGIIFTEATMNSILTISITYMTEVLRLSSTQIGISYFIILVATIPGAFFADWLANKTNPTKALKINIVIFSVVNVIGFLQLNDPRDVPLMYGIAAVWGIMGGWYYPLQKLIFSMIVPDGQESELAGFFLYCTQILSWLPPLIFTAMNEAGINLKWGAIHLNIYFLVGFVCFMSMSQWQKCVETARGDNRMKRSESPESVV